MNARVLNFILKALAVAVACLGIWHYLTFTTPRHVEYAEPVRDKSENRVVKKMTTQIGVVEVAQHDRAAVFGSLFRRICLVAEPERDE